MIPANLKYTKSHEWIKIDDSTATLGITDFAQSQLGDITYIDVPSAGKTVKPGDSVAVVESVKAASDIYAPVSGTVAEANPDLDDSPDKVNSDPYGDGWLCKLSNINASNGTELMTSEEYEKFLENGSE